MKNAPRRRGTVSPTRREIARRARLFNQLVSRAVAVRFPIASGSLIVAKATDAESIEPALVVALEALAAPPVAVSDPQSLNRLQA